jgi:NAD(P)-dependent dehydrogenase (short-subunit alcohol dehydrogenase family)
MELRDKVVVVTGGGNGIGAALCRRFAKESPRALVVADLDGDAASAVAAGIGPVATAVAIDVSREDDVQRLVATTEDGHGPVDLFCANAGIGTMGGVEIANDAWQRTWDVNVMAHVYAARALLPGWVARGEGYLLTTASAAGLLTQLGGAPYSVTKHAAVAFAEWVAIHYGDAGVKVSCLCPQGVRTNMLAGAGPAGEALLGANALEPDVVAETVLRGLADERFLILPHPEVDDYERRRADDRDRWLGGMRKLLRRISSV